MVADGQGNLVTRDTLHQWQSVSDQNVSSMAHVAARDFGFLTLTRPSTARIYNQTRVSCSRCHPGRACRRQRTFALRRPRCGQRTAAADEAPILTPSCAQSAASAGYRHLKTKRSKAGPRLCHRCGRHQQLLPLGISYSPGAFSVSGLRLSFVICGFSVLQMM